MNTCEVPLIPGGQEVPVTPQNVHAYTFLIRQRHLDAPLRVMLHFFSLGLHTAVHPSYLSLFSVPELDGLWSGRQSADELHVWESPAALAASVVPSHGYSWESETIQWFVEVVGHWPATHQRWFLKFVTGSSMTMGGSGGRRRGAGAGGGGGAGANTDSSNHHHHHSSPFSFSSSASSFDSPRSSVLLEYPITVVRRDVEESPSPTTTTSSSLPHRCKNDEDEAHPTETERATPRTDEKGEAEKENERRQALQKAVDASLPSVSTCFHYLKLPKYSSREVLEKQLRRAIVDGQGSFDLT